MADLEALTRRGNDAFNNRDEVVSRSLMDANVSMRAPGMPETKGQDAAIEFDKVWWGACSDAHSEITHIAVEGDTVLLHGVFTGTHDGTLQTPMGPIEATGKKLEGNFSWTYRYDGDRVVDAEVLFDRMQVMEQLGLMPAGATA
jgi:predicted ester cyclase